MALDKQIHLYGIGTDAFYEGEEKYIHKRLLKLYKLKKNLEDKKRKKKEELEEKWKKSSVNRVIKKEKQRLTDLLNERLKDTSPRQLNSEELKDKNVISLFESSLTRALGIKTNELTEDIMIVSVFFFQVFEGIVKNGFVHNNEKYILLTASAGQIRTKRAVFVKESAYLAIQKKMMCGLTPEELNRRGGMNVNKYSAYLALNDSATDFWPEFDIDRTIVVSDFETGVFGHVDFIDYRTYEITREWTETPIPHTDGCGITMLSPTRMVRAPWIKGLLVSFDFQSWIKEYCPGGRAIVEDIYGIKHDIIKENIQNILTASQFKLNKIYYSWEEYKYYFKKYGCEFSCCNVEEENIPKAKINYQMLQTLTDMSDKEIEKITQQSKFEAENIGKDFRTTMKLIGAVEENEEKSWFQKAVMIYPELFRDSYSRDVLKQTKKSLIKQAKAGRLRVNGEYEFVSPDLFAFCQWLFLGEKNPKGLLEDGEVYTKNFRNGSELACLRSPHLYREWPIRKNVRNELTEKWFGNTQCIYTSTRDLISRILQFDCDGDRLLVIKDKTLTTVAKRNMEGIVPLAYELKKAKSQEINNNTMYDGMIAAYNGGNIGIVSNNISKVWNCGVIEEEQLNIVKWLCMKNNQVINNRSLKLVNL